MKRGKQMKELLLFQQPFYKGAIKALKQGEEHLKKRSKDNYLKRSIILEEAETICNQIETSFKEGIDSLSKDLEDKNRAIINEYKHKVPTYTSGTQELLRRQDFEMRVKYMDAGEIKALIGNKNSQGEASLSEYDINVIRSIVSERKDLTAEKDSIINELRLLQINNNIGEEWKNDEAYQENQNLIIEIMQTQNYLRVPDETGEYAPKSVKNTLMPIARAYKEN